MSEQNDNEKAMDAMIYEIVTVVIERGRKHCSGEPLFFDRHNLDLAVRDAIDAWAGNKSGEAARRAGGASR